jgi:hypothetical protein
MPEGTTYWGVFCRTCQEPVAFDTPPFHEFGLGSVNDKPGAILCGNGHNHIYFPRDFHFFESQSAIGEVTMLENRERYKAVNPSRRASIEPLAPMSSITRESHKPDSPADVQSNGERRATRDIAVARREVQRTVRLRWANWAIKKLG